MRRQWKALKFNKKKKIFLQEIAIGVREVVF